MESILLVDASPRVLSLPLAPLSFYLLSSSFRLSKSDRRTIVPYFVSTPILSLGLILSCGSVSALIALGSKERSVTRLLLVDSFVLSLVSQIRMCYPCAETVALNLLQSPLAPCCSYHPLY
jgi:uncharacterized membrane protein